MILYTDTSLAPSCLTIWQKFLTVQVIILQFWHPWHLLVQFSSNFRNVVYKVSRSTKTSYLCCLFYNSSVNCVDVYNKTYIYIINRDHNRWVYSLVFVERPVLHKIFGTESISCTELVLPCRTKYQHGIFLIKILLKWWLSILYDTQIIQQENKISIIISSRKSIYWL